MKLLDSKIIDINSVAHGVSVDELMDNAGKALADVVLDLFKGKKILIVCGNGNNGGDGLAAAYHLDGEDVTVALVNSVKEIKTDESRKRLTMLKNKPASIKSVNISDYDVVVDCIIGAGFRGQLRDDFKDAIRSLQNAKKIISADIASGFGSDFAVKPNITVTFHDLKDGMNENNSGTIIIADIGVPENAASFIGPGDMLRYPIPDKDSHKGQNGRLLIIGGGPYIGAPALAALAAQRVGADLVKIATPKASYMQISSMSPTYMMAELSKNFLVMDDVLPLLGLAEKYNAVLIGPGLGLEKKTKEAVAAFLKDCKTPVIIDADAIDPASSSTVFYKTPVVYTPHHKELEIMMNHTSTASAKEFCLKRPNTVIVAKGRVDAITDGKREKNNGTGCAAMTVGGTGDVFAGTVAGLVSKGMSTFDAACLGAFICGKAGELAFEEFSYGMIATDVIEKIPKVLKEYLG